MKNLKNILIATLLLISTLALQAQKKGEHPKFDVEKHHQQQADFFATEMGLTDAEKKAFTPLMQEYIHARFELNKETRNAARQLRNKKDKTSADYQKVIDMGLDVKIKEAELQKEYFKKFGIVLPAEKVYKYNRAERIFMERTIKRYHRQKEDK